ncbi:MAG: PspC domain-containing protein [Flavobacteriaceae bacterium]|nr:PspC domain-containing protein [Flavobacteriaceae bacterium]
MKFIYAIRSFFEKHGFEVASRLADKLGMRAKNVRLFFIYISFATVGLWFGVYITMAFVLRIKDLVYTKRTSVFDL